jgi:hypothetical protein
MTIITAEDAHSAVEWLIKNARPIADAKKRLVLAETGKDRIKAIVMKKHAEIAVSAQEREARASEEYARACEEEANAAAEFEYLRHLRDTAHARIEMWRSLESSARAAAR